MAKALRIFYRLIFITILPFKKKYLCIFILLCSKFFKDSKSHQFNGAWILRYFVKEKNEESILAIATLRNSESNGVKFCLKEHSYIQIHETCTFNCCSMYSRVCHIFLDFKVSRYIEVYSLAETANWADSGQLQFWSEPSEILNLRSSKFKYSRNCSF